MNRLELLAALEREGVRPGAYAISGAGLEDLPHSDLENRYTLAIASGGWAVYFLERGHQNDRMDFDTEDEACDELLIRITRDPNTRSA
jgi:hypothetical protein